MPKVYEYKSKSPCPMFDDGRHCLMESEFRESQLWCNMECHEEQLWTPMVRHYASTNFGRVMHEHQNVAVGKPISDMRQFKDELARASDRESERMGFTVDYQPADLTDTTTLNVTDEGLDSTHDQAIKDGRKESKGRFVWPVT